MKETRIFKGDAKKLLAGLQGSKREQQAAKEQIKGNSEFKFFVSVNGWQYDRNNVRQTGDLLFQDGKEQLTETQLLDHYPNDQLFFIVPASKHKNENG